MSGPLKNYDVSGKDVLGNGEPAPAGTVLRLKRAEAERLGLEKPKKGDDTASDAAPAEAKPRRASTRKRSAPTKRG